MSVSYKLQHLREYSLPAPKSNRVIKFFCTVIFGLDRGGNSEHMIITEFKRS